MKGKTQTREGCNGVSYSISMSFPEAESLSLGIESEPEFCKKESPIHRFSIQVAINSSHLYHGPCTQNWEVQNVTRTGEECLGITLASISTDI